jgi:ribA/ribD-fused uncharacterized protein
MNHKLDTDTHVFFYENDFYVLSNFSAFRIMWKARDFDTAEHAYHWEKFPHRADIQRGILQSRSAHHAFKLAEFYKDIVKPDWHSVKVNIMKEILRAKVKQHEYVERKLRDTGDRWLVEDSWRDNFWGWGEDGKGQNMLGKLWMEIRDELRDK